MQCGARFFLFEGQNVLFCVELPQFQDIVYSETCFRRKNIKRSVIATNTPDYTVKILWRYVSVLQSFPLFLLKTNICTERMFFYIITACRICKEKRPPKRSFFIPMVIRTCVARFARMPCVPLPFRPSCQALSRVNTLFHRRNC